MDQIRPFPPTDFMDQAEEEEALRLMSAIYENHLPIQNW